MGKQFGYIRVSSNEQNSERQWISLLQAGLRAERIYEDRQSGRTFERPAYQRMLRRLQKGDTVYVMSIDRLGRNYAEIQKHWRKLTQEIGVDIVVLDMPLLDTRQGKDLMGTFIADLVLQILSFAAENEREAIHRRQQQGIAAAKERGVQFGRPKVAAPRNFGKVVRAWEKKDIDFNTALERTGLRESTFYRRLRTYREKNIVKNSEQNMGDETMERWS